MLLLVSRESHSSRKRRILIVDDHDFFATCLRALVDSQSDMLVCDVARDARNLAERVRRSQPHLLVIDVALGEENGVEVGLRLRRQHHLTTPILFVSTLMRPAAAELTRVGRCAFMPKNRRPMLFLATLRKALAIGVEPERRRVSPPALAEAASK